MISAIIMLALLYLVAGLPVCGLCHDLFTNDFNPLFDPLIILIWPIAFVGLLIYALISEWLSRVKEYYEMKEKRGNKDDV